MKLKYLSIPFFISFGLILVSRLYQMTTIKNLSDTAQISNGEHMCLLIGIISSIIIIFMGKIFKSSSNAFLIKKDVVFGTTSLILSILITLSGFLEFGNLSSDHGINSLFISIFGILSGITFFMLSSCFFKGTNVFLNYKWFTIFPFVWAATKAWRIYLINQLIVTDWINLTSVLDKISLVLFLFNYSQLFIEIFDESTLKKLHYWGFSHVIFGTLSITHYLISQNTLTMSDIMSILIEIILCLYILYTVFTIKFVQKDAPVIES